MMNQFQLIAAASPDSYRSIYLVCLDENYFLVFDSNCRAHIFAHIDEKEDDKRFLWFGEILIFFQLINQK